MPDELDSKERYNQYLQDQEQFYQQIIAHQSNRPFLNHFQKFPTLVFLTAIAFISGLILAPYLTSAARTALAAQIAPATDHLAQAAALPIEKDVLDAYESTLVRIYEKTVPSVVKIEVTQTDDQSSSPNLSSDEPSSTNSCQILYPNDSPCQGQGSGFVWDKAGHIVTNFHTIHGVKHIQVIFADRTTVEAEVLGSESSTDLAVLKVDLPPAKLHPVVLGDSASLKVGQLTLAIGAPFGQEFSMTSGIVSAVGRTLHFCQNCYPIPEVIQTDTAINPGSSGGPLLNQRGEVIGINTLIISQTGANTGVAFAISSNILKQIVPALISDNN